MSALHERSDGTDRDRVSTADVFDSFGTYQPKTARMVAEEFGIDVDTARYHLDRLTGWRLLTRARANTENPLWIRAHPDPGA
ncbi:hypothetical protein ACFQE1_14835 [Halobium palmae]|uniref:ArsR family transcriptional regulator n=1 Tax=Halobium palmae TaxID=1776492 RepID=A0ABD5S1N1_9EURY